MLWSWEVFIRLGIITNKRVSWNHSIDNKTDMNKFIIKTRDSHQYAYTSHSSHNSSYADHLTQHTGFIAFGSKHRPKNSTIRLNNCLFFFWTTFLICRQVSNSSWHITYKKQSCKQPTHQQRPGVSTDYLRETTEI